MSLRSFAQSTLSVAGRLYPFLSGFSRFVFLPPYRYAIARLDPVVKSTLRDGSLIFLDPREHVGRTTLFFGDLDKKISVVIRAILRPGDTVVDVGANCGVIAIQAAKIVGASGQVHAFEPQRRLVDMLQQSADANGFRNLHVHPVALSNASGTAQLNVVEGNLGSSSLREVQQTSSTETIEVREANAELTRLCAAPVALVKVDIEGHEHIFFPAAREWFRSVLPETVIFESGTFYEANWWEAIASVLEPLGYRFYGIRRLSLLRLKLLPATIENAATIAAHDVIAVRATSERLAQLRRFIA